MTLGLIQYVVTGQRLGSAGITPGGATTPQLAAKFKRQALLWGGVGPGGAGPGRRARMLRARSRSTRPPFAT